MYAGLLEVSGSFVYFPSSYTRLFSILSICVCVCVNDGNWLELSISGVKQTYIKLNGIILQRLHEWHMYGTRSLFVPRRISNQ